VKDILEPRLPDAPGFCKSRGRGINRISVTALIFLLACSAATASGDETEPASLYSYTGYLTTPSAYIGHARAGFHYSFIPRDISSFRRGDTTNRLYSATVGFLPFLEIYLSVYVLPSVKWLADYGAEKHRSPGLKLRLFKEKGLLPSVAVGLFDPDLRKFGIESSYSNVSSTVIVFSRKTGFRNGSVSLGYGTDRFSDSGTRIDGIFGGVSATITEHVMLLADYDSELFSGGIRAQWRGFDCMAALCRGQVSYRLGFTTNLLGRRSR